jgi:hypothetical protein
MFAIDRLLRFAGFGVQVSQFHRGVGIKPQQVGSAMGQLFEGRLADLAPVDMRANLRMLAWVELLIEELA